MHIQARRIFRLSLTTALALAVAYALAVPLPFMAPLFAIMLVAKPSPPPGLKGLFKLVLLMLLTLSVGLLLIPMLQHYPVAAVLIVALGLYFSSYLTINLGKGLVGALLTVGRDRRLRPRYHGYPVAGAGSDDQHHVQLGGVSLVPGGSRR
jgi:hypothetical protein